MIVKIMFLNANYSPDFSNLECLEKRDDYRELYFRHIMSPLILPMYNFNLIQLRAVYSMKPLEFQRISERAMAIVIE